MLRLHSDWSYLEQEFGCSIRDRFLMAVRSLDNPKAVTPFLLEAGRRRFALFLHVEKGNAEAARLPPGITPVYYRPYFTFSKSERAHGTLVDAVESVAEGERAIVVDQSAPLSVASELKARFSIQIEAVPALGTVTMVQRPRAEVLARLGAARRAGAAAAERLLRNSPVHKRVLPYLDAGEDKRYAELDAAIEEAGLSGLVVSSRLNLQEIAGVPVGAKQRPLAAIYAPDDENVWVMFSGGSGDGRQFASPRAALYSILPRGRLGVEIEDVGLGLAQSLGLDGRECEPCDRLVRRWRDQTTLPDLPFYVIATRITRHAIEAALEFADQAIRRRAEVTEMDAYAVYLRAMHEFAAEALEGARVSRTLTNFHTGARTIFPANAAAHPLNAAMNTLKIDAGCLLFDSEGVLLGCSDIARTLAMSDAARELYEAFARSVRQVLIPSIAPGRTGEAIHAAAAREIFGQPKLRGNPLFFDLAEPARDYDRDVGHLLGKNNLAHLRLVRGDGQPLREGMIACCEYQWPCDGHAIAYEDTCLVAAGGGLNLTSDEF